MAGDYRKALDLARDDQWDAAHEIVQQYEDRLACLIHGYLHRVEGDLSNAGYWYRRAGEPMPDNTVDEEWERLAGLASQG